MARKQALTHETAAAAAPARAAQPKTPRVKTAQHSKLIPSDPSTTEPVMASTDAEKATQVIAQIAYGYWESHGRQTGTELEDWVRAEHEYRRREAATRL